jgi:hypothetical protein
VLATNSASLRVLERLDVELVWRGRSAKAPAHDGDTAHLERFIFADRPIDADTLDAVIALG